MDNGFYTLLIVFIILFGGTLLTFLIILIQTILILRRILTKIELRIDNFVLTREEIKLRLLELAEAVLIKIRKLQGKK